MHPLSRVSQIFCVWFIKACTVKNVCLKQKSLIILDNLIGVWKNTFYFAVSAT